MEPAAESSLLSKNVDRHLSEEQLARIEENRQKALAKRKLTESLREIEEVNTESKLQEQKEQDAQRHISEVSHCTERLCDGAICSHCPVDRELCEYFGEYVCKGCKSKAGELYRTITRSESIATYLIPEESMKVLKFVSKDNPHNSGWIPMKLYLRKHVIALAIRRFGSMEALEEERQKRETAKFERHLVKTDDVLAKQSASFRDSLQERVDDLHPVVLTDNVSAIASSTIIGKKRGEASSSANTKGKAGLNAKRRRMVDDFLSCLK